MCKAWVSSVDTEYGEEAKIVGITECGQTRLGK